MSHIPHNLLLAVDSGGTKTAYRLLDAKGMTVAETKTAGVASLFPGQLCVRDTLLAGLRQLAVNPNEISHCYFSLGGPNTQEVEEALAGLLPQTQITLEREANGNMMLTTAQLLDCSAVVMVGTGSVAVGLRKQQCVFAGGWGPALDDAGSGGYLGMTALRLFLKSLDQRYPARQFEVLFPHLMQGLDVRDFTQRMTIKQRANALTRKDLASVVPELFALARQGDQLATKLIAQTAEDIADLAAAVTAPDSQDTGVLACGGMFKTGQDFQQQCSLALAKRRPDCHWVFLNHTDMIGCAAVKLLMNLGLTDPSILNQHLGVTA